MARRITWEDIIGVSIWIFFLSGFLANLLVSTPRQRRKYIARGDVKQNEPCTQRPVLNESKKDESVSPRSEKPHELVPRQEYRAKYEQAPAEVELRQAAERDREHLDESEDQQRDGLQKEMIQAGELPATEKEQLIKARRGQGVFRTRLESIEDSCRLTGATNTRMLVASHIKPWRDCSNVERLDGNNGLLLSPHVDKLFVV